MKVQPILVFSPLVPIVTGQNVSAPVVDLGYVKYRGQYNESFDINAFFGLRYAQAPLGDLRFRAPQDIELINNYDSSQFRDASTQGPQCVQGAPTWRSPSYKPVGEEDCLLLDVLVPAHPVSTSLPVVVEIHGGGYVQGNSETYPGWPLVAQSRGNLILVNIQYRLGVFGFLGSAAVRDDGTANAGLLDQRAALNWVQRHISAFGGDPTRVTISGGSAGGGSVTAQLILDGGVANPPFSAAIAEYPWWQQFHNDTILETQYQQFLEATNCSDLGCLRRLPFDQLLPETQSVYVLGYSSSEPNYAFGDFYFGPSVDGEIIRDLPSNEFKQGHFTKVPLLTTRDAYEGRSFSNRSLTSLVDEQADLQTLFPFAKNSFFSRLFQLYPRDSFNSTFDHRATIFGDFIINCPTYYLASAMSDYGMPVYKQLVYFGSQQHSASRNLIFNNNYGQKKGDNITLASILKDWYLSFALTHDPNQVSFTNFSKPIWPLYLDQAQPGTGGEFRVLQVNDSDIGEVGDFDASARCDFWHGMSYVARN